MSEDHVLDRRAVLRHDLAGFQAIVQNPHDLVLGESGDGRGRETRVALLGANDAFGEMSIIDMQPRSATVRALAPSRLLKISTEEMDALYRHDLKSYTRIVLNIARDLSRRLRVTDGLLADFTANVLEEYVQTPGKR